MRLATIGLLLLATAAPAQGTRADYERAHGWKHRVGDRFVRGAVRAEWLPGEKELWYRTSPPGAYYLVDVEKKTKRPLFDRARLAKAIGSDKFEIAGLEVDATHLYLWLRGDPAVWVCSRETYAIGRDTDLARTKLFRLEPAPPGVRSRALGGDSAVVFLNATTGPIEIFWIDASGKLTSYGKLEAGAQKRQHTYHGHAWAIHDEKGEIIQRFVAGAIPRMARIDGGAPAAAPKSASAIPHTSPDGKWSAFVRDRNVVLKRVNGNEWQLTNDGTADNAFGGRAFWSPDSRSFVVMRTVPGDARRIAMIDSVPDDRLQPRLKSVPYAKPGDRLARPRPWLFDIKKRKGREIDNALFFNPYSLGQVRWSADSRSFTLLFNRRGHQELSVIGVDAKTAKPRAIVTERSETFVDYAGKRFLHFLDATDELIWMSERSGWNHLYLYDSESGAVKNAITRGEWVVRGVDRVDEKARRVWFWAGGVRAGEDPYHRHYCRVDLDGKNLKVLTEGDGTHTVDFSPSRKYFVDTWSRVDLPPVSVLRAAEDGALVCELERASEAALRATGWRPPERFVAKGRDGKTDIYGILHRPSNFDEKKKYPVVEAIYAGPHGAHVPKRFRAYHPAQEVAELGFIVAQIDGMGTSHRSKAFHDVCWKNLADAGFPDRIPWLRAAAKRNPQMDLTRVGIYGGSAGGQNAMGGLLAHPEFYRVGVADCGCHDNRMDKIWWNELWMGWPIGEHYAEQSNVTRAHRLQGKLLLIVGELDTNVDPASTMQVVDALIKADKDFDLVVIPGAGHGAAGTPYGRRKLLDFLVRHLHGVEPRSR